MADWYFLDAGPLGLVTQNPPTPEATAFLRWFQGKYVSTYFCVASVTDYEVRRELTRLNATARLRSLDKFLSGVTRVPVNEKAWALACRFWAQVRRAGLPTAEDRDLDGDAILAGVVADWRGLTDGVTIVTDNRRHFDRFERVGARPWQEISL